MDWVKWLKDYCPKKTMTAGQAVSKIDRGSRVFIGTGCGEPQHLIRAMVKDDHLQDIMVYQMLSYTFSEFVDDPSFLRRFSLKL
ncbi:MAG TPA: acetyl-CoA hydrolase, partial [Deltaproteobacteria bacterium]|nr:acetyl-CoA hydrolase [Deltaproteobacteria bacterium]